MIKSKKTATIMITVYINNNKMRNDFSERAPKLLNLNYLFELFGSNASRNPSPIKLIANTVIKIHSPGGIHASG